MVYHLQDIVDCIPEEILGFGRELPEASSGGGNHLARVRLTFGRGQGRLLRQLGDFAPK